MADSVLIANKWEILRRLGKGGMGAVYEVVNKLGKRMAVKQLHADLELEKAIFDRFYREAQVMVELKHKHIVEVIDIDSQEGFGAYILMELVRGPDLGRIIRERGALEYSEVLRIGSEVAQALDYAHRRHVIHRDIKPANILIEDDSARAVVTDFGIAKKLGDSGQTNVTGATKEFIGTYRYCAPEQFRNARDVDARVDIYSLGCVLYEMFRGKPILWEMDGIEVASRMAYSDMKLDLDFDAAPPAEFAELVAACLDKDRNTRIATARILYDRLEECRQLFRQRNPQPPRVAIIQEPAQPSVPSAPSAATPTPTPAQPSAEEIELPRAAAAPAGAGEMVQPRLEEEYAEAQTVPLEDSVAILHRKEQERLRGQLAEQIRGLRKDVANRRGGCEALRVELAAQSVAPTGNTLLDEVDSRLRAAEQLEDEGELENARANLEKLNDSVAALWSDMRGTLRGVLEGAGSDLRQEWQALNASSGGFLAASDSVGFERLLQPFTAALQSEDWDRCRNILLEAGQHVRRARDAAGQRAAASVRATAAEAARLWKEIEAEAGDSARAHGPEILQPAVDLALEEGRWAEAQKQADQAVEKLQALSGEVAVRRRREAARAARQRFESARSAIDAGGAEVHAGSEWKEAQRLGTAAAELEKRSDWDAALGQFEQAAQAVERVRVKVRDGHLGALRASEEELRDLLERAARAPDRVVGAAREEAETFLTGDRTIDPVRAKTVSDQLRVRLGAALAEAALYEAAVERQAAAQRAAQEAAATSPAPDLMAGVQRVENEAKAAFERSEWGRARERYDEAVRQYGLVEQAVTRAAAQARVEEARAAAEALSDAINAAEAREVAPDDYTAAEQTILRARQAEQRNDLGAAQSAYEEARGRFEKIRERVVRSRSEQLLAVERELRQLLESSTNAQSPAVFEARSSAERQLAAPRPDDFAIGYFALEKARDALAKAIETVPLYEAAQAERKRFEQRRREVTDQTAGDEPTEMGTVAREAEMAFARFDWVKARDRYAHAIDWLDEFAKNRRERAERERVAAQLAEEQAQRLGEREGAVRQLLEKVASAPEAVGGAARKAGQAAIAGLRGSDAASALIELERAEARLQEAIAQIPLFVEAEQRRERAREARASADGVKAKKSQRREADGAFAAAETTFGKGDWRAARDAYDRAIASYVQLVQAARPATPAPARAEVAIPGVQPVPTRAPSEQKPKYAMWAGIAAAGAAVVFGGGYVLFGGGSDGKSGARRDGAAISGGVVEPPAVIALATGTPTFTVQPPAVVVRDEPTSTPTATPQVVATATPSKAPPPPTTARPTASVTATIPTVSPTRARNTPTSTSTRVNTSTPAPRDTPTQRDTPTPRNTPTPQQVDAEAGVRTWLGELESALESKDVPRLAAMLKLEAGSAQRLKKALDLQEELQVTIRKLAIERIDDERFSVRYERVDEFTNPDNQERVTRPLPVSQTFRVRGGQVELVK